MQPEITKDVVIKLLGVIDTGLINGIGNADEDGKGVPGSMCVEAAVCYALGLPHGDDPQCVAPSLRSLKIRLNDSRWSSAQARAKGLRRLAVIQLGSKGHLNAKEFSTRCAVLATKTSVPIALRAAASIHKDPAHVQALRDAANRCEIEGTHQSALDAREVARSAQQAAATYAAAAYAAYDAAYDAAAAAAAAAAAYAATYAATTAAYAAYAADAAADAADAAAAAADARDKSLADFAEGVVQILIAMDVPGVQWLALTKLEEVA
jgi:hypothetical protein